MSESHRGKIKTKEHRENLSKANKGKKRSQGIRIKIAERMTGKRLGDKNPFFGKKQSEETKKKISMSRKGQLCEVENPRWGVKLSEETKQKISAAKTSQKYQKRSKI